MVKLKQKESKMSKDSIENILLTIDEQNLGMVSRYDVAEVKIYRQGFEAAINAMAEAFNIKYTSPQVNPTHRDFLSQVDFA